MTQTEQSRESSRPEAPEVYDKKRKPYAKPKITYELDLETRAGSTLGFPDPLDPFSLDPWNLDPED